MTDSSDDAAARWHWRQQNTVRQLQRAVEDNLHQLGDALDRAGRGAYGVEDFTDDVRTAWSRSAQNMVELMRLFAGLAPSPDETPVVNCTIEDQSQTSGPILFPAAVSHDLVLELEHLHLLAGGEAGTETFLSAEHFAFDPVDLDGDDGPTEVLLRMVGLNQHTDGGLDPTTHLPIGRYIGFIGGHPDGGDFELIALLIVVVEPAKFPAVAMT